MRLIVEVLADLLEAIEYFDSFSLVHVRWLEEPVVLLHVLGRHPLVQVETSFDLLEFLLKLVELLVARVRSDDESHW